MMYETTCWQQHQREFPFDVFCCGLLSGILSFLLCASGGAPVEKPLFTLKHCKNVYHISVSPDGHYLASCGGFGVVIWDVTNRKVIERPDLPGPVNSIAFSRNGKKLAIGGDGILQVYELPTKTTQDLGKDKKRSVYTVCFSPKDDLLAVGGYQQPIELWDPSTLRPPLSFQGHTGSVNCLFFLPDGKTLISGGSDELVIAWDVSTGKVKKTLKGHTNKVMCGAASPTGEFFVTGGYDQTIRTWRLDKDTPVETTFSGVGKIFGLALSSDGKLLAACGGERSFERKPGAINVWHLPKESRTAITGHTMWIKSVTFLPNTGILISGGYDTEINAWPITK